MLIPWPHGALDTRSAQPSATLQRCYYDIDDHTMLLGRIRCVCCIHAASVRQSYGNHPHLAAYLAPFHGKLECFQFIFIRPFEKRDVLCCGNVRPSVRLSVRPSVCPSVRPSVRPRFPDFSSTCFEISIWNLVYTFSRWHDMSSLSCTTIGSLWPNLQPKVGQTYFLQSWPHK